MAFVGEGFPAGDSNGGEKSPTADETGLTGRKTDILDGQNAVVMKDVTVDHAGSRKLL